MTRHPLHNSNIASEIISRLEEDMASSPVDDITLISRPQLETIKAALRSAVEAAAEITRLREALEWYANPEIYRPHPHGLAFDNRDMSFTAKSALSPTSQQERTS